MRGDLSQASFIKAKALSYSVFVTQPFRAESAGSSETGTEWVFE